MQTSLVARAEREVRQWAGGGIFMMVLGGAFFLFLGSTLQGEEWLKWIVLISFLASGAGMVAVGIVSRSPRHNTIYRALGPFGPPRSIAREIDRELNGNSVMQFGTPPGSSLEPPLVMMTDNWLLQLNQADGAAVCRIDRIAAVEHRVAKRDWPPVVHSAVVRDSSGTEVQFIQSEAGVAALLEALRQVRPDLPASLLR